MGPTQGDPAAGRTAVRVLVADDSEFARRNAAKVVAHLGGEVVGEAATGRQAVERYRALRPDLVLMDITMPEMQGVDAVEAIMKEDPAARIVMVTSVGHQEVVRRALGLGARYFLMKPLQFEEAVAALRFVLETPAGAETLAEGGMGNAEYPQPGAENREPGTDAPAIRDPQSAAEPPGASAAGAEGTAHAG